MMRIRILARAGVGAWPPGAVIELDDPHAQRLVLNGYAERVPDRDPPKKTRREAWPSNTN